MKAYREDVADLLISQLAERCGVPATTLRFYEGAGLLPAGRTPAGYRVFGEDAVRRLRFITTAKRLGLPLDEIAELLRVWADGSCSQVRDSMRPRVLARIAEAELRAGELAAFTATLHDAIENLDALPDKDGSCDEQCGFPDPDPLAEPAGSRRAGEDAAEAEARSSEPIACSLDGDAMGDRIRQWHDLTGDAERRAIPGGLRLSMPVDRAATVAGLAAAEQRCCPFFAFTIHFGGERLHLEVRVPAEAQTMLTTLFG